jgi:hypothetical protein
MLHVLGDEEAGDGDVCECSLHCCGCRANDLRLPCDDANRVAGALVGEGVRQRLHNHEIARDRREEVGGHGAGRFGDHVRGRGDTDFGRKRVRLVFQERACGTRSRMLDEGSGGLIGDEWHAAASGVVSLEAACKSRQDNLLRNLVGMP